MKNYKVDARGLDCPKPLLRTKQALEKEEFDTITVLVGNVPARENVLRFLNHSGMEGVEWQELGKEEFSISAARGGEIAPPSPGKAEENSGKDPAAPKEGSASGKTVLIASARMGTGEKGLGSLLMKGYVYTLTQLDVPPRCVIFMNSGVKLSLQDSESLDDLKTLEEKGVKLLVCGTCLDFLNVREQMGVGVISNMYEIASELHAPGELISLT